MGRVGDLVVRIVGEDAQFRASIDKSEKKLKDFDKTAKKLSDSLTKVGKKMTTFVTLPILGIGAAFVKTAADAEEVNSKFNIVFRDQAKNVREWAEEFSEATGRATVDNIKFLASVQDLFVPLGLARNEAADLSKSVVTLATDMGSFNNLPTKDVLRDIQSALVGNHETVRKYGVVLSEITVNQELLNMGIEGGYKAATAAEKAIARYNLIIAGTSDAQGDAIRTAGSFTNRFIALQSSVKDLAEGFGNLLIPTIQKMVEGITKAVRWVHDLNENQKQLIIRIAGIAAAIGPLIFAVGKMVALIRIMRTVMIALNTTMLATPWGLAIAAVAGLTVVIWKLTEAAREEKKLDKDIIALKDELYKVRGEEQVRIQETIVAKLRNAYVTAEAHAMEMQQIAEKGRATGRGNVQTTKWQQLAEKSREKADRLRDAFAKENEELVRLTEMNRKASTQRIIGLPILEEEDEDRKKLTDTIARSYDQMRHEEEYIKMEYIPIQSKLREEIEKTTEAQRTAMQIFRELEGQIPIVVDGLKGLTDKYREQEEYIKMEYIPIISDLDQKILDLIATKRAWATMVAANIVPMFEAFGQIMIDQADAAEILGKAFQDMIVGILKAIAQKLTILGIEALIPIPGIFNPIGAPAAFAGAAAAAIAAGVVAALALGGLTTGMTPAILHPNEAVLPLDNEEAMSRIANAIANASAPSVNIRNDQPIILGISIDGKQLDARITKKIGNRKILISKRDLTV